MHILNCLFAKKNGGIEQSFVDYAYAMRHLGWRVTNFCHPNAAILPQIRAAHLPHLTMRNLGAWDRLAIWRMKELLEQLQPDAILIHGNRPLQLLARARAASKASQIPLLAVAHNQRLSCMGLADAVIAVNPEIQQSIQQQHPHMPCHLLPNMLTTAEQWLSLPDALQRRLANAPFTFGCMARLVEEKNISLLLQALARLKQQPSLPAWRCLIAGDGHCATS